MAEALDEAFIDTNLLIYALGDNARKREAMNAVLYRERDWVFSTQVVIEYINVCQRKDLLAPEDLRTSVEGLVGSAARLILVDLPVIQRALSLHETHSLSWWDSLIVAAALQAGSAILYTEDLQHGQTIDGLRIENPFHTA